MNRRTLTTSIAVLACAVAATGCTTYHKVTDNETGETFYTTNWDLHEYSNSGAVRLKDHMGNIQIVNDAQVTQIVESEYQMGTGKQTKADKEYLEEVKKIEE